MASDFFQPVHLLILFIFLPAFLAVVIIPYWQIFKKAGFSPLLSLLIILPVVNLITLYVVAFSPWRVVPAGPDYPSYPPMGQPGYGVPPHYPPPSGTV